MGFSVRWWGCAWDTKCIVCEGLRAAVAELRKQSKMTPLLRIEELNASFAVAGSVAAKRWWYLLQLFNFDTLLQLNFFTSMVKKATLNSIYQAATFEKIWAHASSFKTVTPLIRLAVELHSEKKFKLKARAAHIHLEIVVQLLIKCTKMQRDVTARRETGQHAERRDSDGKRLVLW